MLCCIASLTVPTSDLFILVALRPQDLLLHDAGIDYMNMVVVHVLAQRLGHCPVAFIGMHDHRKDILLANDFSIADL